MNTPLEALERLKGAVAYFDGLDPIIQKLSGQISISAEDLRSLLSSYEAQGERLREACTVINDLLMPIPHTEASLKARQRAADFLSRAALTQPPAMENGE